MGEYGTLIGQLAIATGLPPHQIKEELKRTIREVMREEKSIPPRFQFED